jgi:hypothetical protein
LIIADLLIKESKSGAECHPLLTEIATIEACPTLTQIEEQDGEWTFRGFCR